jgi:peptide deformylase
MANKEILQLGNSLLWEKSLLVPDPSSVEIRTLVGDLSDTLASFRSQTGYGRGIAAPQLGALKRVIFVRMQPEGFCSPLINPQILSQSDERFELWDDCFSFPDLMVRVSRARRIRVCYLNEAGTRHELEAEGALSELLQHEIDHLDGILAVNRAISPESFSTRAEWERRFR